MFKKSKMDIIAGLFIVIGTGLGIWANEINKKEAKTLEEAKNKLALELLEANQENLELNKKFDRYAEEMKFFTKKSFSFLQLDFPYGFTVIKQNKEYEDFTQVFGNNPFNIDFKSNIVKTENGKYELQLNDIMLAFNNFKFSAGSVRGEIDVEDFGQIRLLFSAKIISKLNNINDSFRIGAKMIDGSGEFLYAIGLQKDEDPTQLSQILFDLDKPVVKQN